LTEELKSLGAEVFVGVIHIVSVECGGRISDLRFVEKAFERGATVPLKPLPLFLP
jgi:hypothetical protein